MDEQKQFKETTPAAPAASDKQKKRKRKKAVKGILIGVLIAALVGGAVFGITRIGKKDSGGVDDVMTAFLYRGSITSRVEGSGVAVAKNSASVTLAAASNIIDVFVTEGDHVYAGDRLFTATSPELENRLKTAQEAVNNARDNVTRAQQSRDEQQRQLNRLSNELATLSAEPRDMNATAPFSGVLTDVPRLQPGDRVSKGERLATITDDSRYLLSLYFSYTYENEIWIGLPVTVSIPVMMSQLPGTVSEVHKVERLSPEGGKLFEVLIVVENPGSLTEDMEASATFVSNGETVYPYEGGKLEAYRRGEILSPMDGELDSLTAYNYSRVAEGQSIALILGTGKDEELESLRDQVESAKQYLRDAEDAITRAEEAVVEAEEGVARAQENLDNLDAVAPIDGTILAVGVFSGDEVQAGHVAVSLADTSTMIINASVDEMNVSNIKTGMTVEIDQWGQTAVGFVESVSLTGQYENGVSRFPVVISVDNSEDMLRPGSYVSYAFTASQSDDCLLAPIQCVKYVETEEGRQKAVFVRSETPPENAAELMTEMTEIPAGFWPVLVETGISDSSNVEILSPEFEEGTELFQAQVRTDMYM
ncbi:MAG: HlyD family efflux transporter periplasmic adaptor subunit [Oscillospiraceae bacterium]|nr:HlyD family efflux transporter periplasmic adaptor subunit [Oscillospiraceae bacterium]